MKQAIQAVVQDTRFWLMIVTIVGGAAVAGGVWWGYQYYAINRDEKAQWAFAQVLERFDQLDRSKASVSREEWTKLASDFSDVYKKHSSSVYAPFIRAFQGNSVAMQGSDYGDFQYYFHEALENLSKRNPLYYLYATKLAVIDLDAVMSDASRSEAAKRRLLDLAQDSQNPDPGYAWYQLLQFAIAQGDLELYKMVSVRLEQSGDEWSPEVVSQVSDMLMNEDGELNEQQ